MISTEVTPFTVVNGVYWFGVLGTTPLPAFQTNKDGPDVTRGYHNNIPVPDIAGVTDELPYVLIIASYLSSNLQ